VASITIDVDLPPGVTITAYERYSHGHGFEASWPWPTRCRCDHCRREEEAHIEDKEAVQVDRDLDPGLQGQAVEGRAEGVPVIDVGVPAEPQDLSAEEKAKLVGLFQRLPRLRTLYELRVRLQRIFETAPDRRKALRWLTELWTDVLDHFPEMDPFI
jgi:hypothetical protein